MTPQDLISAFDTLAEAPEGVKRLRELVLQLAVRGKLVPQNPEDGPASALLERIAVEKVRVLKSGDIPKPRANAECPAEPIHEFDIPETWTWSTMDKICTYIQRGKSPEYDDESDTRVVSQKCVQWSGFDLSKSRGIEKNSLRNYGPERFLCPGDLLWNSTGTGTVGRINVYPGTSDGIHVVADSHVTVVRSAGVDPQFIWCWLAGVTIQGRIEEMTTGTTKQQELGTGTIRNVSIPIPPLAEQKRIVARVDELMSLLDRLETHLTNKATAHNEFAAAAIHHLDA